jgi:hypothetical protein
MFAHFIATSRPVGTGFAPAIGMKARRLRMGLPIAAGIAFVTLAGAIVASRMSASRFARRVRAEERDVLARGAATAPRRLDPAVLERLPPPVRRYLTKALGGRDTFIRTVRLRHGGTFRPGLDKAMRPIRGEQVFGSDPPSFVWLGRVPMGPGLWIAARDRSVDGVGNMLVRVQSSFTVVDAKGPELDEGAMMRLLGELTWFPTAFVDDRYVTWAAVDDRHARATLRVGGRDVTGTFELGDDDLPQRFRAQRYRDTPNGGVLTPWEGRSTDFRRVDGVLVPHTMSAVWIVDGKEIEYARFTVERVELDVTEPSAFARAGVDQPATVRLAHADSVVGPTP